LPPPAVPTLITYSAWSHQDEYDENFALNNTETADADIEDFLDTANVPIEPLLALRRGGASSPNSKNSGILQGGKTVVTRAASFWKSTIGGVIESVQSKFQSKETKKRQELLEALKTMPVRQVVVSNSTVLPPEVIRTAVKRSGMVGSPLKMDRVQELARNLKRWYTRQGYVLHSVTGAALNPDTATATISVEEPFVSVLPVDIVVCKEMVIDEETGELVTFKQYRAKKLSELEEKRSGFSVFGRTPDLKIDRKDLNTTLVPTTGRTNAKKIAQAMKLTPGTPFQWLDTRWSKIASSGVFSKVLKASPEPTTDGGVCLQVYAMEPPPRHLEYGIGKSVWTNSWEGEVDFDWRNIFGGGESVGVMVRRGSKDSSPSVRLRYGDDKFGLEGGYDIEAFNDFLGDTGSDEEANEDYKKRADSSSDLELNQDSLLNRRGATFRLRNPISTSFVTNSVASASMERTSTTTGQLENIGSASLTLGPFRRFMPMDGKTSVSTTLSGGARLVGREMGGGGDISFAGTGLLPYSSASATTKQILPITISSRENDKMPITLALQHTVSASTSNIPRHEAKAMANSAQIRGAAPDDSTTTVVKGTTEIRLPVAVPRVGNGSVVLFGDWFCVQKNTNSPFYSKSSIGVGIRKSFQGLPLKYDICYSSEGKIKKMFGIGADFDV